MIKNQFKVGQAVVYKNPAGDSISATIKSVHFGSRPSANDCVYVAWYPVYAQEHTAMVLRKDFGNLTPFGNSLFLAL